MDIPEKPQEKILKWIVMAAVLLVLVIGSIWVYNTNRMVTNPPTLPDEEKIEGKFPEPEAGIFPEPAVMVTIRPEIISVKQQETQKSEIYIRNPDSRQATFNINLEILEAPDEIAKASAENWIKLGTSTSVVLLGGKIGMKHILVSPPESAKPGNYLINCKVSCDNEAICPQGILETADLLVVVKAA